MNRRSFFARALAWGAGLFAAKKLLAEPVQEEPKRLVHKITGAEIMRRTPERFYPPKGFEAYDPELRRYFVWDGERWVGREPMEGRP